MYSRPSLVCGRVFTMLHRCSFTITLPCIHLLPCSLTPHTSQLIHSRLHLCIMYPAARCPSLSGDRVLVCNVRILILCHEARVRLLYLRQVQCCQSCRKQGQCGGLEGNTAQYPVNQWTVVGEPVVAKYHWATWVKQGHLESDFLFFTCWKADTEV
jgi:hypothetical protein